MKTEKCNSENGSPGVHDRKFVPKKIFSDFNENFTKQQWACPQPVCKFSTETGKRNSENGSPDVHDRKFVPKKIFSDFDENFTKQQWGRPQPICKF